MKQRILLVEDEMSLVVGLRDLLTVKGYDVAVAMRGDDGLRLALQTSPDLILLDVMMPGLSGFEVLQQLREQGRRTPVILLTARNTEMDKVLGFEMGVDDYVTKPFSLPELFGRIAAVLRRTQAPAATPAPAAVAEVLTLGSARVDLDRYTASRGGTAVELPSKAIDILRVLWQERGKVVTRDSLMDRVWGNDATVNERTVTNLMVKLRSLLEDHPDDPRYLKTVHGVGYRLEV